MPNEVGIDVVSHDKTGPGMDSAKRRAEAVGKSVKSIGEIAGGILTANVFQRLGAAAVHAFTDTIRAASGLEQALGGTKAVFGDASGAVDSFADRSAEAAGLSEREFREMTTLVGGQLKRMTGDVNFAGEASVKLTQIAADLAATYGGTTRQAMESFAAALRGEADPAERFNLNLKQSVVAAKAVEMGLAASTSEVNEQAKAQAMLALITEQSADAQGQFAREGDTAAVAHQKLTASIEDAQASIGQGLLPVLAKAAEIGAVVAEGFAELPGPVQAAVVVIAALAAGVLLLVPRLAAAKTALAGMGVAGRGLSVALGPISVAIAAVTAALGMFAAKQAEAKARSAELTAAWDAQNDALTETARQQLATNLQQSEAIRVLEEYNFTLEDAVAFIEGNKQAAAELAAIQEDGGVKALIASDNLAELKEEYDKGRASAEEVAGATGEVSAAHKDEADAVAAATEQVDAATKALSDYADEQRAAVDPVFALTDALEGVDEAQQDYTKAVEEHGKKSPQARSAAIDLARAVSKAEGAALDGRLSFDRFDAKLRQWVRGGQLTAAQAERIRERVRNARKAAEDYKGNYAAKLTANIDMGRLAQAKALMDQIARPRTTYISARVSYPGVGFINRGLMATGGMVGVEEAHAQEGGPRGGSRILVGEQGPEIAELPFGTRVIPSGQTRAELSGTGSGGAVSMTLDLRGANDSALASLFALMVRTGKIRLLAGDQPVRVG